MTEESQTVTKVELLAYFRAVDALLVEEERAVPLYLIGGSLLAMLDLRKASKDIDCILGIKEYPIFERAERVLRSQYPFRVDYFVGGWLPDIRLPEDFPQYAQAVFAGEFRVLRLHTIGHLDFLLSKIIAHRERDLSDAELFLRHVSVGKD